ncbi:MAG: hypothetical protein Kow0029_00610 [Candidatus Rifleibacteriota bacterium]
MKSIKYFICLFFAAVTLLVSPMVRADIDLPDYQATLQTPDFILSGKTYAKFETEKYVIDPAVNNLIISADIEKSENAMFRGYVRLQYAESGKWTDYLAFDSEYHFSSLKPVAAYQMMFVIRDPEKGTTKIKSVTVNGNYIPEEKMEYFLQKPVPFEPMKVVAKPTIVSRAAWGARPPKSGYTQHSPQRLIVHHSYIPNQSQYKGAASIRGIQNYHMDDPKTKWNDIGYHFLIGPEGTIYQGRPETVVGAHCSPNTNSVGICLIGDYDPGKDPIPPVMENSLLKLLAWLSSYYRIDPRVNLYGHCDFSTKSCPGKNVYDRLPEYKKFLIQVIGEKK